MNSLKIRHRAVKEFGYNPTLMGVMKLLAQVILVVLLPERVIVPLYLVVRGIASPWDFVPKVNVAVKKALAWVGK
jgi:hypothetical protein